MVIVPDTKNWTWVLQRICPECGFDVRRFPRDDLPALIRASAGQWRQVLAGSDDLRRRPRPDVWSPLEYACHVRDAHRKYAERLAMMLGQDDPAFPDWDQDATAVADRYGEQDPAAVSDQLRDAADRLADAYAAVSGADWKRTGTRSDGSRFTVESIGRYFIHDPVHHLYDVTGATMARPEPPP